MKVGTVAEWSVAVGDAVDAGDVFCEIETDKATVDFECQEEGIIAKILVEAGVEIACGTPVAIIVDDAEDVAAFADYSPPADTISAATADTTPAAHADSAPAPAAAAAAPAAAAAAAPMVAAVTSTGARVFASPLARKIAREKGFDIAAITGTGPHGRVVLADVDEFVPAAAVAAAPAATALTGSEDFTDMKPTTIRKIIAARCASQSMQQHGLSSIMMALITSDCGFMQAAGVEADHPSLLPLDRRRDGHADADPGPAECDGRRHV